MENLSQLTLIAHYLKQKQTNKNKKKEKNIVTTNCPRLNKSSAHRKEVFIFLH